jgi:hypothetical protein
MFPSGGVVGKYFSACNFSVLKQDHVVLWLVLGHWPEVIIHKWEHKTTKHVVTLGFCFGSESYSSCVMSGVVMSISGRMLIPHQPENVQKYNDG